MRIQRILEISCYLAAAILLTAFIYMSPHIFVADSEFWSLAMGYHFLEEFKNSWVFTRPLFYGLLWISQCFYSLPSESVFWARSLFLFNGLLVLYLMFYLSKKISRSTLSGALAILLLLGNTGFLNQGFRIRSDLLATTLTLISWILMIRPLKSRIAAILLPLLATPKAILFCISLVASFYIPKKIHKGHVISLTLLAALFIILNWNNATYFLESFGTETIPFYFSWESFYHLKTQVVRNPLFWGLFVARFFTRQLVVSRGLGKDKAFDFLDKKYEIFVYACFFLMTFSTEKVQYFIASFLPFFAIYAGLILQDLKTLGISFRWQNLTLVATLLVSLLGGGYWTFVNIERNHNYNQMKLLDSLNDFLTQRDIKSIQDFNCLLPAHCHSRHFIGPHQSKWNEAAFKILVSEKPDIFFYLKKAGLLEPKLGLFLESNYIDLGHGIFVRKNETSHFGSQTKELLQNGQSLTEKTQGIGQVVRGSMVDIFGYDVDY